VGQRFLGARVLVEGVEVSARPGGAIRHGPA